LILREHVASRRASEVSVAGIASPSHVPHLAESLGAPLHVELEPTLSVFATATCRVCRDLGPLRPPRINISSAAVGRQSDPTTGGLAAMVVMTDERARRRRDGRPGPRGIRQRTQA